MKGVSTTAAILAALIATPALAGPVTVTLQGVEARGGKLLVALQTEADFMKPGGFGQIVEAPPAGPLTVTFDDVPAGDYALSALHDVDGDGQMDVSDQGIPVEGWAMTNGDSLRGPPVFDQVKVAIGADGATLTETIRYWDGQIPGR